MLHKIFKLSAIKFKIPVNKNMISKHKQEKKFAKKTSHKKCVALIWLFTKQEEKNLNLMRLRQVHAYKTKYFSLNLKIYKNKYSLTF